MLKLKNLNESFAKQYDTAPKEKLNEAFNDSFPSWLKSRLGELNKYHGTDKDGPYGGNRFKVPRGKRPNYSKPRGFSGRERELSLFDNLLKGTNIDELKVIEGPIPTKRTDERLKSPNIPIWHFPNGQVYIQGYNDNEIDTGSTYIGPKGSYMAFKYTPVKYFLENADAFAYIDSDQIEPSNYESTRKERAETAKELRDLGYGRKDKDLDKFVQPTGWSYGVPDDQKPYHDASGYLVDPRKYIKKLEDIKANDYARILQERHDAIIDLRNDITAAMQYYDPVEDKDVYRNLWRIMDDLNDAVSAFNNVSTSIEQWVNSSEDEQLVKRVIKDKVKELLNDSGYKRAIDKGTNIFLGNADWLA